jgi:ribonuclease R
VEAWLKCKYMREHLGEEYAGAVSAVTSFGLFVTLTELYVEGLVHITELGGEYFRYDEVRQSCAASAPASATAWARACGCRSAGSTWTRARSTFAWCRRKAPRATRPAAREARARRRPSRQGRARREAREGLAPATERRSPMQVLTAAVKKAAAKAKARKGGKPRR